MPFSLFKMTSVALSDSQPATIAAWRQVLAAVHPDRGGDPEQFIALTNARDAWLKRNRLCARCRKHFTPRTTSKDAPPNQFCSNYYSTRSRAEAHVVTRKLKTRKGSTHAG